MPVPCRPKPKLRLEVIMLLLLGAMLALPFDVVLARFFLSDPFPGELRSLIHKSEFFGHAYGILGIAFTLFLVCEPRRRELPRLLVSAFTAGVVCDVVKLLIQRVRPVDFSFVEGESTFLGIGLLQIDSFSHLLASSNHSFPSAHTATAVAFAMTLGVMYPKGARWFLVVATLVGVSRFDGGAHYMSDTFVGGMLGYVTACWMLGPSWVGRWFDDYEQGVRSLRVAIPPSSPQPT